jgi:hypothetical protein
MKNNKSNLKKLISECRYINTIHDDIFNGSQFTKHYGKLKEDINLEARINKYICQNCNQEMTCELKDDLLILNCELCNIEWTISNEEQ